MTEYITRKEFQDSIYKDLGITPDMVKPTYRDKIDRTFTLDELRDMDIDEFNHYFDMGDNLVDQDPPKSTFKEANKTMKSIEEKSCKSCGSCKCKTDVVFSSVTYENYLKSVTPKSSFKDANKKMKEFEK
jgi:hypothetical protein